MANPSFNCALPIWRFYPPKETKNDSLGFYAKIHWDAGESAFLRIAGGTSYRVFLDRKLVHYGPARTPKGFARLEEICLSDYEMQGLHHLAIQVVSYGVATFSNVLQQPFLQAEVEVGGNIISATGVSDHSKCFRSYEVLGRIQKTQRYSYMRSFAEARHLSSEASNWMIGIGQEVELEEVQDQFKILPRRVPIVRIEEAIFPFPNHFFKVLPARLSVVHTAPTFKLIGNELDGFTESEIESYPWKEYQTLSLKPTSSNKQAIDEKGQQFTAKLHTDEAFLAMSPTNLQCIGNGSMVRSGLLGIHLNAKESSRILVAFDSLPGKALHEKIKDSRPAPSWLNPYRENCVNLVELRCEPGEYEFWSEEPFTWSHIMVVCLMGNVEIQQVSCFPVERQTISSDELGAKLSSIDPELEEIFQAGLNSLRMNSFDFYTDTVRERGGYLCDSYFTASAGSQFLGDFESELAFFENFALPVQYEKIPDGMMPMCYPADALGGTYIPQWPMWFLIQCEDFLKRGGPKDAIHPLQPKFVALFEYLKRFENEFGLLENLPGWNFIEYSQANDYVQNVSFPTNMLYSAALLAYEACYEQKPPSTYSATKISSEALSIFWDGEKYLDCAKRGSQGLELQPFASGIAQHFPYFLGFRKAENGDPLLSILNDSHYLSKVKSKEILHAEMTLLPGLFMRWKLLLDWKYPELFMTEIKQVLGPQASLTGSIWETVFEEMRNDEIPESWDFGYRFGYSCSHGFGSYICVLLSNLIKNHCIHK